MKINVYLKIQNRETYKKLFNFFESLGDCTFSLQNLTSSIYKGDLPNAQSDINNAFKPKLFDKNSISYERYYFKNSTIEEKKNNLEEQNQQNQEIKNSLLEWLNTKAKILEEPKKYNFPETILEKEQLKTKTSMVTTATIGPLQDIAYFNLTPETVQLILSHHLYNCTLNGWEDLAVFYKEECIYFTTTHEQEEAVGIPSELFAKFLSFKIDYYIISFGEFKDTLFNDELTKMAVIVPKKNEFMAEIYSRNVNDNGEAKYELIEVLECLSYNEAALSAIKALQK